MTLKPGAIIYVVWGSQGSYSDHSAWTCGAYLEKATAEALAAKLQQAQADFLERQQAIDWDYSEIPTSFDPEGSEWFSSNRKYGVAPLFIHADPAQWLGEREVMLDVLRERGEAP